MYQNKWSNEWRSQECALDILKLWPFTRLNPLPIRKTSNEQMFKQRPTGQLKKGNIIHRMDDVAIIGFGFTMLFGYSRLIAVKKMLDGNQHLWVSKTGRHGNTHAEKSYNIHKGTALVRKIERQTNNISHDMYNCTCHSILSDG